MNIPAEDRDNLGDDIGPEIFTLDELSAIYEASETEIISAARQPGCSAVLIDSATDEYPYL